MKFIIALVFLFIGSAAFAQVDSVPYKFDYWKPNFKNYTKMKRQQSLYCIEALQNNGALLVRLKTRKPKIDVLKAEGYTTDALRVETEQYAMNKAIVNAFRNAYGFSKVYFFYNDDTEAVKKGVRRGIFLNDDLAYDPDIKLQEEFYLIAELDNVEADPIGFPSKEELKHVALKPVALPGRALVIRDKYFIQLRSPFPFYVMAPDDNDLYFYVSKLDQNLTTFYNNRSQVNLISPKVTLFWFNKEVDKIEYYYKD